MPTSIQPNERRKSARFLVVVHLGGDFTVDRLRYIVPEIVVALRKIARDDDHLLAFRSADALTFGYFINTTSAEWAILKQIEDQAHIERKDKLLILEMGDRATEVGFSRARAWFDNH